MRTYLQRINKFACYSMVADFHFRNFVIVAFNGIAKFKPRAEKEQRRLSREQCNNLFELSQS